jgi:3-phenylpropionate/trans-cinnamate dioxygenase ferredoxin subunit
MGEFITVTKDSELRTGEMKAFDVGDLKIAVARVGDKLLAFSDTCTHRKCPLSKGELEASIVTCPCHGSQFDVSSGAVLNGPAEDPVGIYQVRVEGEEVQVEV